jgi:hypothetical protein
MRRKHTRELIVYQRKTKGSPCVTQITQQHYSCAFKQQDIQYLQDIQTESFGEYV